MEIKESIEEEFPGSAFLLRGKFHTGFIFY